MLYIYINKFIIITFIIANIINIYKIIFIIANIINIYNNNICEKKEKVKQEERKIFCDERRRKKEKPLRQQMNGEIYF